MSRNAIPKEPIIPPTGSPTNTEVGAEIGLNHSTVSRIRRGERNPSLEVMMKISTRYGWGLEDQALAVRDGSYGERFEEALINSTRPEQ